MKKLILFLAILTILANANAIQLGNETSIPQISSNSFKMMSEPQIDSEMFIQFRLVDANQAALENYHTELKIYDLRGVLVYPRDFPIGGGGLAISFSDSNGFINYKIFLNSCNLLNDGENCFQLDQTYTVTITGKSIIRQENFTPKLKTIETNWFGDGLRFLYVNIQAILLITIALVLVIALISQFLIKRRRKK